MEIHFDLHTHSIFAGGTGSGTVERKTKLLRKRIEEMTVLSSLKGITHLGTGDVQFEPYMDYLRHNLEEITDGMYVLNSPVQDEGLRQLEDPERAPTRFVLQTELIFTAQVDQSKRRKKSHVLILFPSFKEVEELNELLDRWGVSREKMARPFIVCRDALQVEERTNMILDLDPGMELVPAHVMTPEGVYGGEPTVSRLRDFFGDAKERIHAIETGLSADPDVLSLIPELDSMTFISNADAHSAGLNKIGREFTSIVVNRDSYSALISSIRDNKVSKTAEFHPSEGRFFLTGHRENRKKPYRHKAGEYCYYSPKHVPEGNICPICGKRLTVGVLQRAFELSRSQGEGRQWRRTERRPFVTVVPLVEIIALDLGIKSVTSKKVVRRYLQICEHVGSEVNLWVNDRALDILGEAQIASSLLEKIRMVRDGKFRFDPPGYDGVYGKLKIGDELDLESVRVESFSS